MRYSLRSLMIAVGLTAVAATYAGNVIRYQGLAASHEQKIDVIMERLCPTGPSVYTDQKEIAHDLKLRHHHGRMADAYRKAAWRPWVTVREAPAP